MLHLRDLVANRVLGPHALPTPIPTDHIQAEIERALRLDRWTLRFTMPLRISHSKKGQRVDPATGRAAMLRLV